VVEPSESAQRWRPPSRGRPARGRVGWSEVDATFQRTQVDGQAAWVGKCLHCGRKLVVRDDGRAMGQATLEHVWPQSQGGSDEVANLAVACSGCNREKGTRHDHGKRHGKAASRLDDVARVLRERRRERWRDPASVGMAARLAPVMSGPDVPPTE
jgi:5-methylcytosine-specific restriction endonuclease McrA